MTDLQEKAIRMALEDICGAKLFEINSMSSRAKLLRLMDKAAQALRQALAQPEQEPVAEIQIEDMGRPFSAMRVTTHFYKEVPAVGTKLYTAPPKQWVGLTDREREEATGWSVDHIEAFLKEKNT